MVLKKRSTMRKLSDETARKTDLLLQDEELQVFSDTTVDWEKLRPQLANDEKYDQLIREVEAATSKNESIAKLRERVEKLGSEGIALAKKVARLAK